MTRSAGMRIFEQNRISGSIEFTGILMIEGTTMNKVFKDMEVPSHDKWEPKRCRENAKKYEKIYNELKKYIKECVNTSFGKEIEQEIDAFGANDFLPDIIIDDSDKGKRQNTLTSKIKKIFEKEVSPQKIK